MRITQRKTSKILHRAIIIAFMLLLNLSCMNINVMANPENIAFSDPQKPIIVKKSQPLFSITLQSNPTTGFLWSLKNYDSAIIKPIRKIYHPAKTTLIGRGGYEQWTFAVKPAGFVVPQTTNITLIYARYSELEGAQLSNFKVVTSNDD